MKQILRLLLCSSLLLLVITTLQVRGREGFPGPEADSLDPLPSWIDTTFYRDMVGNLRFSGWPVMDRQRRDDLMSGRPVKSYRSPHQRYVKVPATSSEVVHVLAWHVVTKTYFPWQAKDPTVPRYDTMHHVATWIRFNDSAGTTRWLLMVASLQSNSHLGTGQWILPSALAFLDPWTFGMFSDIRNNDSLVKILAHPASDEYRQFLRDRMIQLDQVRLYDHPPTNSDIVDFLIDYSGGSSTDPDMPAFFDPYSLQKEGYTFLKGSVRSGTWRHVTGANPPFSFSDD